MQRKYTTNCLQANCQVCGKPLKPRSGHKYITTFFCSPNCFHVFRRVNPLERFWSKVDKSAGPDGCWLWTAGISPSGYGQFGRKHGDKYPAHRYIFEQLYGSLLKEILVCHTCEDRYPAGDMTYRRCVNPAHLYAGTHMDNMADMVRSGRVAHNGGEKHYGHKLTQIQVNEIRKKYATGIINQRILGTQYGVSASRISMIVRYLTWKN